MEKIAHRLRQCALVCRSGEPIRSLAVNSSSTAFNFVNAHSVDQAIVYHS
jgi:hypothetical protein